MLFTVDRLPHVNQQIRTLAERAKARGLLGLYLDSLRKVVSNLEDRPLEWGDPEYHTKQPGGLVCHGTADPLLVRFVVFELQQVVVIIDILPMSLLATT